MRVKHVIISILVILIILLLIGKLIHESFKTNIKKKTNYRIIMFLTGGLVEEAENCIQSLKNLNLNKKLIVTALDDKAYNHIKRCGVTVKRKKTNLKEEAHFGTADFYEIVYNKLEIIENNMKKKNEIVVYSDSDIVFLNDIYEDIDKFKNSEYDIMLQNDVENIHDSNKSNLCTGFMFFKNNKKTKECIKLARKLMKEEWHNRGGGLLADQRFLNKAIQKLDINVGVLDLKEYPNGPRYFYNKNTIYKNFTPKIVHNNYLVGTKNKIKRFKDNELWFIKK